jgi:uncharacterized Zn-binding protein involved in type VI secretion
MGQPAAKLGDKIVATDIHIVMVPTPVGAVPIPSSYPFSGIINGNLSANVNIMGCPAATVNSIAINLPPHIPMPPGVAFQNPPSNKATVMLGSVSVLINGKMAARNGDKATTCNDPADLPSGTIIATGTVMIG